MVFQRRIGLGGLALRCGIIWAVFNIGGFYWTAYQLNQLEKKYGIEETLKRARDTSEEIHTPLQYVIGPGFKLAASEYIRNHTK